MRSRAVAKGELASLPPPSPGIIASCSAASVFTPAHNTTVYDAKYWPPGSGFLLIIKDSKDILDKYFIIL
jgi:hypothetical protein